MTKAWLFRYTILWRFSALAAGGVFAGVNPSHTSFEFQHAFKIAKVKCLIVEPELLKNAFITAEARSIPRSRIIVFDVRG